MRFPSWPSTVEGTSVGVWVTKNTPTPFDRMRRAVRSICSRSAGRRVVEEEVRLVEEEAELRLREVPGLRQGRVELREEPEHERAEQARPVHDVRELEERDDAGPVGRRPQEVGDVELRLAEERAGALLLEHDDRAEDDPDRRRRDAAVRRRGGLALVRPEPLEGRPEVGEVEQGQRVVVAVREDEGEDGGLGLVEVEDLREQGRPERVDVARTGAPSFPDSESSSTGWPAGSIVQPSDAHRSTTFGFVASPGSASPVRSPLTSAMKHGTPARESWPARD